MQRFLVPQVENRAGPAVEKMRQEVRVRPPQPPHEPWVVATGLKRTSERFMKRKYVNSTVPVRTWVEFLAEFTRLQQGNFSVLEYVRQFD